MKQLLRNMYVDNKRVILRCDLNVPISNGIILDNTKVVKSLETINYLLSKNCKIIILSHLGRVKTEDDKLINTLEPVKNNLEKLLNRPIKFTKNIVSEETKNLAFNLQAREILLLENTRHLDVPNKLESVENEEIAKYFASLGEIYVLDAFASAHRSHTSVTGIPKYLPSCLGFLVEKELSMLDKTFNYPARPFAVLMGGAKVDDKLPIIKSMLTKCDYLLLSGGIANSFLYALGLNVGSSLKTDNPEIINELKTLMFKYKEKFALPLDVVVTTTYEESVKIKNTNEIDNNDIIKDIGIKTINKYKRIINESNTVFINGTVGVHENEKFNNGTIEIFNILKQAPDKVVIGGGDTVSALNNLGFKDAFTNICSGGGASLEYIANGHLPGIDVIAEEDEIEILDL
ncbi:MAG: phosphoglycerate kinase [Firmicutes bacterium]|nr:phosphoglycerate kinase [Bacillota bacterium]